MDRAASRPTQDSASVGPASMAPAPTLTLRGWRRYGAVLLRGLADRLGPEAPPGGRDRPELRHLLPLAGAARLDFAALEHGEVRMRYRGTDAVWARCRMTEPSSICENTSGGCAWPPTRSTFILPASRWAASDTT